MATEIIIDESYIDQILTTQGFPLITLDDIEIKNPDDFKNLIIQPVMRLYFIKFPIITSKDYYLGNGNGELAFPSDLEIPNIYTAVMKLNNYSSVSGMSILYDNPFVKQQLLSSNNVKNDIGSVFDYGFGQSMTMKRVENKAIADTFKAFRYDINLDQRKIFYYTNIPGKAVADWMSYSYDFNVIVRRFYHLEDVIQLCQARLLRYIGRLRSIQKSGQSVEFNYDAMINEANEIETRVLEKFNTSINNPPVVRW